jgi:hypothetical protein
VKAHKFYFLQGRKIVPPQSRGIFGGSDMNRETNDIVELGSVSTETAGDFGPPVEIGGKDLQNGISLD